MSKKLIISIILVLALTDAYLLYNRRNLKQEIAVKDMSLADLSVENMSLHPQFAIGLANVGRQLEDTAELRDAYANKLNFRDLADRKNTNILFCRISERYCHECCQLAVAKLLQSESNFDMSRVVFLNDCLPRELSLQIEDFNLSDFEVYNCRSLNMPAENLMAPYYFVTDNALKVRSIYVPSKQSFYLPLDSVNLNLMYSALVKP